MMQDNWHLPATLHAVHGTSLGVEVLNKGDRSAETEKNGGPVDECFVI